VADYDPAIPPGGEGKVTLRVDLSGYEGEVRKTAVIYSNDPRRPSVTLTLKGKVRTVIEIRPDPVVRFQAGREGTQKKTLEIFSEERSFQIKKIETEGADWLSHRLEPVVPGRRYLLTLTVPPMMKTSWAEVRCSTDHPEQPNLRVRVEVLP
jgi:hypothetical protein